MSGKVIGPVGAFIFGVVLIIIIILISTSLNKLASNELGIKYDNIAKTLGREVQYEGLHIGPPGFSFIIFPSVYETMGFSDITCLNKDGVIIELEVSYQFKANGKHMRTLIEQFKDFSGYKKILKASGKSAVHDSCANFSTTEFQTDRGKYQESLREIMRTYCNSLHCELNDLQVNKVQRPYEFESAVKEKEAAKENIKVAKNERPRKILQAQTEFEQANKQAEILMNNAKTQARILKNKAETEAKSLEFQYKKDLDVYKKIKESQGLDNEALISYIGIRAIANSKQQVNLAMQSPARTSYKSITD